MTYIIGENWARAFAPNELIGQYVLPHITLDIIKIPQKIESFYEAEVFETAQDAVSYLSSIKYVRPQRPKPWSKLNA